ncbi:MAG: FAD-dependent oxidoreductase [Bacillota bacterium]
MAKKILIIGAGYAGVEAALKLHKKSKKDDVEITLIDKNPYHTLLTELHEVAGNRIAEDGIIVPLKDIFKYTKVNIVVDEIDEIHFQEKKAVSKHASYEYDYLVLAAGSRPAYYGINGLRENGFTLWSYNDAIRIREHIINCFQMAMQEKDATKRQALLTFAVGGGGFTGVEMIGEIGQWVKVLCKEYGVARSEVKLYLIEAMGGILQNLKKKNVAKVMKYLTKKLKVDVLLNHAITNVTKDDFEVKGETTIPSNTLIWCAGIRAARLTEHVQLEKEKSRIKVNEFTETSHENVYVVGDSSAFTSERHTLPALVETALQTGEGAAMNILLDVRGKEKEKVEPKLHGVVVSVGANFAVSDIMGFQLPILLSIIMKYFINVHYLFGIGGFELTAKYLKHELFDKKQKKMILEKHYTSKTRAFWMVPLRLLLGYVWLMEGIAKINDGWFSKHVLAGLAAPNSGASTAVAEAGKVTEKVFRIVTTTTPDWYAWIANNVVLPNWFVFQVLIVLVEIGLGLAFISGSFNFIAGAVSLGLIANFFLSTGFYEANWWYIPAAFCMMGGAGRAFGLDYYIMPYLMRQWRYFVRNKRIKLWL